MNNNIKRGNIFYANLDPVKGSEEGGIRPVLVLQNNVGNMFSETIIIAPITTKLAKLPTHVSITPFKKIQRNSTILLEQIRAIDKSRLMAFLCSLPSNKLVEGNKSLALELGLKIEVES